MAVFLVTSFLSFTLTYLQGNMIFLYVLKHGSGATINYTIIQNYYK